MTIQKNLATASLFAIAILFTSSSFAKVITPTSASSSTAATDLFLVSHLIDNSGLSGPPYDASSNHAGSASGNSWVTNAPNGGNGDYFANGTVPPVLTFGLGGLFHLDEILVWNYVQNGENEAMSFGSVAFSNTGVGGTFSDPVAVSPIAFDPTGGSQTLSLGGVHTANAVQITVTDNYFGQIGNLAGGDRVGLSEVKFGGEAVPEPSTIGLALVAILSLSGLARRRRNRTA